VSSDFRREMDENCALPGYYAASNDNLLPTFRDYISVPSSMVKNSWPLKIGPTGFPETSARNYYYSLRNKPEERSSQIPLH